MNSDSQGLRHQDCHLQKSFKPGIYANKNFIWLWQISSIYTQNLDCR